jgi:hypothetical protein
LQAWNPNEAVRVLRSKWHNTTPFCEESNMPVILLWGIPALVVIGGGGYWLMHMH